MGEPVTVGGVLIVVAVVVGIVVVLGVVWAVLSFMASGWDH